MSEGETEILSMLAERLKRRLDELLDRLESQDDNERRDATRKLRALFEKTEPGLFKRLSKIELGSSLLDIYEIGRPWLVDFKNRVRALKLGVRDMPEIRGELRRSMASFLEAQIGDWSDEEVLALVGGYSGHEPGATPSEWLLQRLAEMTNRSHDEVRIALRKARKSRK